MARTRLFLAVEINDLLRNRAITLQQSLALVAPGANWVSSENLHLTLVFLGEVDDKELFTVCRAAEKVGKKHSPFSITLAGVGAFPHSRRPRTVWAGVSEGHEELIRLQDDLSNALIDAGTYRREERAYVPHLTLGRVKSEADGLALSAELKKHADWQGGDSEVAEVLVMSSTLRREGPEYTVVGRAELAG